MKRLIYKSSVAPMCFVDHTSGNVKEPHELKAQEICIALNKLAEYEDAEEKGLLFKLPCKAGSTIYIISRDEIIPLEIYEIGIVENNISMKGKNEKYYGYGTITVFADKKPIEWFYTKEEAEEKLKELKNKTDIQGSRE